MIGTTAAIIGAAAIGAGSQIYGASQAAKGQKKAAAAVAAQQQRNEELLSPYMQAGTGALSKYQQAIGLGTPEEQQAFYFNFQSAPGALRAQQAGLGAVNDKYALTGSSGGNVRAALYDYGQRNMLDAYNKRLAQIGGLVDTGRTAATSLTGTGTQSAATQAGLLSQAGLTMGQGITGAGNALTGGLSNLANYNMWQQGYGAGTGMLGAGNVASGANYAGRFL